MLTGRRAFAGETITDTLARILEREPDWTALPTKTPASIRTLLERCLRKDPRKRLHDIADALIELDDCAAHEGQETDKEHMPWAQGTRAWLPWVLTAAIAATGWVALRNRPAAPASTPAVVEVPVNAPDKSRFAGQGIAVSPDGRHIAFIATSRIGCRCGSDRWTQSSRARSPIR